MERTGLVRGASRAFIAVALVLPVALLLVAAAASCSVFNGLTVPEAGAADDAAGTDDTSVDGAGGPDVPMGACTDDFPGAYLSLLDGARVCSMLARCPALPFSLVASHAVPPGRSDVFSACMHWVSGPLPPTHVGINSQRTVLQCIAKANACQDALNCVALVSVAQNDPRCNADGGPPPQLCLDPNTVLRCDYPVIFNCPNEYFGAGAYCGPTADGGADCITGMLPTGQTCGAFCASNIEKACEANDLFAVNCDSQGLTCGVADGGLTECVSGGTVNCSAGSIRCGGDTVWVCAAAFFETPYECAAEGEGCVGGDFPRCTPKTPDCTPEDSDINVCNGSTLSVCVDGRHRCVDCAAIGQSCLGPDSMHPSGRCG
jgi:hypothetical protein